MKAVKKVLAGALMATMAFSTVAFADISTDDITGLDGLSNVQIEATSETTLPTISVTVPTSAKFIINPFGIEAGGSDDVEEGSKQILSTDMEITNGSDVAVDVVLDSFKAEIQGKSDPGSDKIVLASAPIQPTSTSSKKDVFLYLGVKDEAFNAKTHAKQVVKTSATGLNTKLGTLDAENGTITLAFDGSVNKNAAWNDEDAVNVTPTFKFVPQMSTEE